MPKRFQAFSALVLFLSGVKCEMLAQVPCTAKLFRTDRALKGLQTDFSCMLSEVFLKLLAPSERFEANLALKGPLSGMSGRVRLQIAFVTKPLETN